MATTEEATADLAAVLGATPPASLAEVDPAVVEHLTDALAKESARQEAEIGRAVDDALRLIPRPFRRIVRKLVIP